MPWLPGTIVEQCGPDEWYVCVVACELAVLEDDGQDGGGHVSVRRAAHRRGAHGAAYRDGDPGRAGDGLGRVVLLEENRSARERVCRMNAVCEHRAATRSDWCVRAGLSSPAARRRP